MRRMWLAAAAVGVLAGAVAAPAQQTPVAAMYAADQKRDQALLPSFATAQVPGAPGLRVYLSAGDLERAFDEDDFRPDAAILPTNTQLAFTAASPATQGILIARVRRQPEAADRLESQAAARRAKGPLEIGTDAFMVQLPTGGRVPALVCFVATDFPQGGAVDRRELFAQDRVRQGAAQCLAALDAAGARTVMLPLMGASSSETQSKDAMFEGQRLLKECRLMNSVAGLSLGIHDFAPKRRSIREIGLVQWDREIREMFDPAKASAVARASYQTYAEQVIVAWRKGLGGDNMTPGDAGGNCVATFTAR